MVARSRLGQWARLLIGSCAHLVAFRNSPVVRPYTALRCAMGLLLRESGRRKEQGSPVCSTRDQVHLSDERGCRTAGCERGFMPWQVATRLRKARNRSAADTVRIDAGKNWHTTSVRVQAARLRLGSRDCGGSQASLNSDCQKTGESNFSSSTTRHVACNVVVNAFQQYERLVNLATAKLERR